MPQGAQNPNLAMFAQMAQPQQPQMPQQLQAPNPMPQAGPQGMPQGIPQIPPHLLQQIMAAQQNQVRSPQGGQIPPQGMPQGQPQLSPRLAPPGAQGAGQSGFNPQELAALGRNGDSVIAHLTPGELTVPPQVQTPKVLATLRQAFAAAGVPQQNFVAGSPQSSVNPQTGMPEYSLWSSILPAALGIGAGIFAPELLPALSPELAGAIGSGVGTAAGGMLTGQNGEQALLSGLGAGAGGYAAGSLMGGGSSAAASAAGNAGGSGSASTLSPELQTQFAQGMGSNPGAGLNVGDLTKGLTYAPMGGESMGSVAAGAGAASASPPGLMNLYGALPGNAPFSPAKAIGSTIGASLGASLAGGPAPSPQDANANLNAGFNKPYAMPTKSYQDLLGQNSYSGPSANFSGFNPSTYKTNAFNFFPAQGQSNPVM